MCKRDCVYAGSINSMYGGGHSCNYCMAMQDTNRDQKTRLGQLVKKYRLPATHRKIKLLMLGANCPFYEEIYTGKKKRKASVEQILPRKKREKQEYRPPADEEKLRELYDQGLSDRKVAETLEVKESLVYRWRKERGLPGNFPRTHNRIDEERARKLYDQGLTDNRIALAIGCSQVAVCHWRKRNGLEQRFRFAHMDYVRIRELYEEGLNDTQISRITGNCTDAIRRWRKRNGLESNWEEVKTK